MSDPVHIEPSRRLLFRDVVIQSGQNLSSELPLRGYVLKGLILPTGWTVGAGIISFQAARPVDTVQLPAGGPVATAEFLDVYDDAGAVVQLSGISGSSRYVVLGVTVGEKLVGVDLIKVRSGTPAAPTNQGTTNTVALILGASTK